MYRWLFAVALLMAMLLLYHGEIAGSRWLCITIAAAIFYLGIWCSRETLKGEGRVGWFDRMVGCCAIGFFILLSGSAVYEVERVQIFEVFSEEEKEHVSKELQGENWLWKDSLSREMPKRSNHRPKNRPEVFIEFDDTTDVQQVDESALYVKGFSLGGFNGSEWSSLSRVKQVLRAKEALNDSVAQEGVPIHTYKVTMNKREVGQNVLMALQNALEVDFPRMSQIAEDLILLPATDQLSYAFAASSQPLVFRQLRKKGFLLEEGESDARYLEVQLPAELKKKIRQLVRDVDEESGVEVKLLAIKELLQQRCRYALKVENSNDLNVLENFLFEERVGYCEHFATAAVLLCREMGIPSRIAYGYAGGSFYKQAKMAVFRSKNAHAWAEVYLKGYGWVVFETTPPNAQTTGEVVAGDVDPPALESPSQEPKASAQESERGKGVLGVLAVLGVVLCLLLYWRKKSDAAKYMQSGYHQSKELTPHYYRIFETTCQALGIRDVGSKSMGELIQELHDLERSADFFSDMEAYHNGIFYQDKETEKTVEEKLTRQMKQWRDAVSVQ